jgi:adenylate cyclase class 2
MSKGRLEVEIKLPVASGAAGRRLLRRLGAKPLGRVHEMNTLYDTPEGTLGRSSRLLRVRRLQVAGRGRRSGAGKRAGRGNPLPGILTFKAPAEGGRYKVREELELVIDAPERAERILEALGFRPWFRYEKYRASYRLPGLPRLSVELDETPVGDYFELEGARQSIDRAARRMGYGPQDYVTASYFELFLRERERRDLEENAMLFSARK